MCTYVVYNINTKSIVKLSKNLSELEAIYSGSGYKIMELVPLGRHEW